MSLAAAASVCVARVSDGDSLRLCSGERVRLIGIDAPELRGSSRCAPAALARLKNSRHPPWCDHARGEQARAALAQFLMRGPVQIERRGLDAYGRTLARVTVNGRDAGEWLISRGLARPWR
ncbi:MAG: thermonuclease family protein [Novosphingobium meiothermophilum]